ncbi:MULTISPECIES: GNAT family N-acetyltransferase [Aerococcus]|uniref:GNAT family N-acetyltransferase n=1 Tax=Aerococcus TaxID=1375 RepID=UPI003B225717
METFKNYTQVNTEVLREIWNDILVDGVAFPGLDLYSSATFEKKLTTYDQVDVLLVDDQIAGYYLIKANNEGRASHVANGTYAVNKAFRGQGLINDLVAKSIETARIHGFRGIQFNAVVAENEAAIHTYEKFGFEIVGTIPGGFQVKDGRYVDMHIMYLDLTKTNL